MSHTPHPDPLRAAQDAYFRALENYNSANHEADKAQAALKLRQEVARRAQIALAKTSDALLDLRERIAKETP